MLIRLPLHRLPVMALMLVLVLAGCNNRPTPAPVETVRAPATTPTSAVSIPSVSSSAGLSATLEPAPQPLLSPTNEQSPVLQLGPVIPVRGTLLVEIETSDNVRLTATYYTPAAVGSPAVIMLHMAAGQRGDWDTLARKAQELSYGVLAIDFRGHGGSQGERDWPNMVKDVQAAFNWLRARPEIDAARIGIIGASIGANIGLNFAAAEPGVKTLVLLSPGLDYEGIKTEAPMQAYGMRPVLLVASREDTAAADAVVALDKLAQGPHDLQLYDGQGHGTRMLGRDNGLEDLIVKWLQEML